MNLLGAILYDPASAASKATSSLLAMTAFDTTNLRLAITVPAHGYVRFKIFGPCILGATTYPQVLLGVMKGAAVVCRGTPVSALPGTALATTRLPLYFDMVASGLATGAGNYDAAYAVQVLLAATNIKYGGPNDATGADAFGGFSFEAWDPQPQQTNGQLVVDANGRVDVSAFVGSTTAGTNLSQSLQSIGRGTVTTGGSTTSVPTSAFAPAGAVANQFAGRVMIFDAGTATTALRGQATLISASSNASTPTFTVGALTTAPASGDTFSVV